MWGVCAGQEDRVPRWHGAEKVSVSGRSGSCRCSGGCRQLLPPLRWVPEGADCAERVLESGQYPSRPRSDCCQRRNEAGSVMRSECLLLSRAGGLCRKVFPWKALRRKHTDFTQSGWANRAHCMKEGYAEITVINVEKTHLSRKGQKDCTTAEGILCT